MGPKICQNCCNAIEATAVNRTILLCNNKQGSEQKYYVVARNDSCTSFKASRQPPTSKDDGARLIPLTQGRFAIVDAADYERLAKYKWCAYRNNNSFYACRGFHFKKVCMHRQILHAPSGMLVDHIDRNGLNNRKSNLRVCTAAQNCCNRGPNRNGSSKYKGVYWHKRNKKWLVGISAPQKRLFLGSFVDQLEAAIAYDRKAEVLFGEFAYLNFPDLPEFRKQLRKIIFNE